MPEYKLSQKTLEIIKENAELHAAIRVEQEDFGRVGPVKHNGKIVPVEDFREMLRKAQKEVVEKEIKEQTKLYAAMAKQASDKGWIAIGIQINGNRKIARVSIDKQEQLDKVQQGLLKLGREEETTTLDLLKNHNAVKNRLEKEEKLTNEEAANLLKRNQAVTKAAKRLKAYSDTFIEWREGTEEQKILRHKKEASKEDRARLGELEEKLKALEEKLQKERKEKRGKEQKEEQEAPCRPPGEALLPPQKQAYPVLVSAEEAIRAKAEIVPAETMTARLEAMPASRKASEALSGERASVALKLPPALAGSGRSAA